jgi:hypothetical protein
MTFQETLQSLSPIARVHYNVLYAQPTTPAERIEVASACALRLDLTLPMLIDDLENSTDRQYSPLITHHAAATGPCWERSRAHMLMAPW